MKVTSLPLLLILVIAVFSSPIVQGYGVPTQRTTLHPFANQIVQVWFDALPQLTIMYPPAYSFNVGAKTSSGLWITNLHWDFNDGSILDVPFSGQSQVSEIRTHQYTDQNNHCVSVTASDNAGNTGTTRVSVMPDFNLTAAPPTQTVTPGDSATYTVNVGLFCGRSVHVGLTTSSQNPSNGITWNLNPTSGDTPFTSTLQVQTATTTPKGTYTINVIGTGAGITHTVTVTLIVIEKFPYFNMTVDPPSLSVSKQSSGSVIVTIHPFNGFNSPVNLTLPPMDAPNGPPKGMSVTFSTNPVTPSTSPPYTSQATITVDCNVNPNVGPGTYAIQIKGTSGSLVRDRYVSVQVASCGDCWTSGLCPIILIVVVLVTVMVMAILFRKQRTSLIPAPLLVPAPLPIQQQAGYCPTCGKPMSFYEAYRRWYCSNCQRFV